ncbi:uncharacterized protein [Narcine bancroftii]|uniref:uncharacterized protein n=1 Tax=Narcine bancroftii TaxID=1343680 RepID=UPI0038311844
MEQLQRFRFQRVHILHLTCSLNSLMLIKKKAINRVSDTRLLNVTGAHVIPGMGQAWIEDWLIGRRLTVGIEGVFSAWLLVPSGALQGSIIHPGGRDQERLCPKMTYSNRYRGLGSVDGVAWLAERLHQMLMVLWIVCGGIRCYKGVWMGCRSELRSGQMEFNPEKHEHLIPKPQLQPPRSRAGAMASNEELDRAYAQLKANMGDARAAMQVFHDRAAFSTVAGVLKPIFQVAGAILQLVLGKRESEELTYMKEQFQTVRNQLDVISQQIREVLWEIERSTINSQYFPIEENLKNQFRKYMDISNAAPEFREHEKTEFLTHFDVTKGDQNLHTLFDAVMGISAVFGKPILDTAMSYGQRNRRQMEGLCCRLKELFCIGLIALMGQAAITGSDVGALQRDWNERLARVEAKMEGMIDRCIREFPQQAEMDVEQLIEKKGDRDHKGCATAIIEALTEKYDWVRWSVRVYDPVSGFDNHCVTGPNRFHFFRLQGVNTVVSYSTQPEPIDKARIRELMQGKDSWNDARLVVEAIAGHLPSSNVVHAVRRYKDLWLHKNFPDACHFWETYSGVTLCVHST